MTKFKHRMLEDIHAQPTAISETLSRNKEAIKSIVDEFSSDEIKLIYLSGSGTSYHAGLASQFVLSSLAKLPTSTIPASEFVKWTPTSLDKGHHLITISQSGESKDIISAAKDASKKGARVLAITNTEGSTLTKIADDTLLTYAGEEVAVTATKTFTSQLSLLYLLSLTLALKHTDNAGAVDKLMKKLWEMPRVLQKNMGKIEAKCSSVANAYKDRNIYFILGSGSNYATALEGALKLKEACNVFSEGFATREFLHGPVQLVNDKTVLMLTLSKMEIEGVSELVKNFKGYGAPVIAVSNDSSVEKHLGVEGIAFKGEIPPIISPLAYVVPFQLYVYYKSIYRGLNPDEPEKLSKVVK